MFRLLLTLLFLTVSSSAAEVRTAEVEPRAPIWPLDLPTRYLTSNFMEYRPGRFHAGLDLKTQTVNGFAARAVEDGWIVRVRATPTAYGRAVYLRGESGRTYVYAHLSRFSDRLRVLVNQQRADTGTYRARLQFKSGEVRVRQGEVLGLTGESGTGGPHLHFEVRDTRNRPTDPQSAGFAVGDTIAPLIRRLRVWPVNPETRIQSARNAHILELAAGLCGEQPPLRVTGPVAFSASITDQSDIRAHSLEPSEIEVHLDGHLVYACRNEQYDYAENALQRLEWVVLPGVREHWLHRHPHNTLFGREGDLWYLGAGEQGLPPGRHEIRISAADRAGNRTTAHFELVVDGGPHGVRAVESLAWHPDPVSLQIIAPDSLSHIMITPFFDVDSESVRAAVPGLRRREYTAAAGDPVMAPLVVYSRVADLNAAQRQAAADQGLRPLGVAREFLAATWPIEASLPVAMRQPVPGTGADRTTWGLYRWHEETWKLAEEWPTDAPATAPVKVHLDQTGLHAVLADHSPPVIGRPDEPVVVGPGPASDIAGVTLPRWAVLPVAVRDLGAGLAAESIRVLLDGKPLLVEPDLPRDRILVEFPDEMTPGAHHLAIEAADRTGHVAALELKFQAVR